MMMMKDRRSEPQESLPCCIRLELGTDELVLELVQSVV